LVAFTERLKILVELYETDTECFISKSGVISLDAGIKLSNKQRKMLNLAAKVAETSELSQQHGAVIVKSGRVISVGVNKWRNKSFVTITHPHPSPHSLALSYHAEIDALNRAGDGLNGAIIYIARINTDKAHRFSRPCKNCMRAIREAGIKKIVYTTE
jgi:deoxycytidylate deaminase